MVSQGLQPGHWVSIRKPDLQGLIERLLYLGYRVVGPQVRDGAVVFDDLDDVRQLPIGVLDVQDGGTYRLREDPQAGYFDFVVGPHSLKNFLFPPRETILELTRSSGSWQTQPPATAAPPLAALGVRVRPARTRHPRSRVFTRRLCRSGVSRPPRTIVSGCRKLPPRGRHLFLPFNEDGARGADRRRSGSD